MQDEHNASFFLSSNVAPLPALGLIGDVRRQRYEENPKRQNFFGILCDKECPTASPDIHRGRIVKFVRAAGRFDFR